MGYNYPIFIEENIVYVWCNYRKLVFHKVFKYKSLSEEHTRIKIMPDKKIIFQTIYQQALRAKDILGVNAVSHYFKNFFNVILEISMYVFFIIGLYLIFQIPIDPIQLEQRINSDTKIISILKNQNLSDAMIAIRIIVFFISLVPLFAGILLGIIRRKNNKMKQTAEILDKIKMAVDNELKMASSQINSA